MLSKETPNIYADAIRFFGIGKQIEMLQEECGELVAACNHFKRGRIKTKEFAGEIADVEIMIEQMKIIYKNEISIERGLKIARLQVLINCLDKDNNEAAKDKLVGFEIKVKPFSEEEINRVVDNNTICADFGVGTVTPEAIKYLFKRLLECVEKSGVVK